MSKLTRRGLFGAAAGAIAALVAKPVFGHMYDDTRLPNAVRVAVDPGWNLSDITFLVPQEEWGTVTHWSIASPSGWSNAEPIAMKPLPAAIPMDGVATQDTGIASYNEDAFRVGLLTLSLE